jgi:hypothetical protein
MTLNQRASIGTCKCAYSLWSRLLPVRMICGHPKRHALYVDQRRRALQVVAPIAKSAAVHFTSSVADAGMSRAKIMDQHARYVRRCWVAPLATDETRRVRASCTTIFIPQLRRTGCCRPNSGAPLSSAPPFGAHSTGLSSATVHASLDPSFTHPICTPDHSIPTQALGSLLFFRSLLVLYIEGRLTKKVRKHAGKGHGKRSRASRTTQPCGF